MSGAWGTIRPLAQHYSLRHPNLRDSEHGILGQFVQALRNLCVTRWGDNPFVMATEVKTVRTHRTWFDKLKMWQRAYETKISDERHEAIGRGATREVSEEAAERQWVQEKTAALRQRLAGLEPQRAKKSRGS
jgi:hypothetical protein